MITPFSPLVYVKKHAYFFSALLLLTIGIVVWSVMWFWAEKEFPSIEELRDEYSLKVPYDTRELSIILSDPVDSSSITKESVTLTPHIDGTFSLSSDKKTVTYTLSKNLEINELYELRIASWIQKIDGTPVLRDQFLRFLATPGAEALKIFPTGELDNLKQPITVVFNTPMVALTNLDQRDTLPCPFTMEPKGVGKCRWITSSILEFTPEKPLEGATRYQLRVENVKWLEKELKGTLTGEILTTPLDIEISDNFSPKDGILVSSNFPLTEESLQKSLEVSEITSSGKVKIPVSITPLKLENKSLSETDFIVQPKTNTFTYQSKYLAHFAENLLPKYGNESLSWLLDIEIASASFVTEILAFQNIYSWSNEVVETKTYRGLDSLNPVTLPNEGVFFHMYFDEEVSLDQKMLSLVSEDGTDVIPYDMTYVKEETYDDFGNKTGVKENKHALKINWKKNPKSGGRYKLVIKKDADSSMKSDEIYLWKGAEELKISDFKLRSNTLGCIYVNNELSYEFLSDKEKLKMALTTIPNSKTPSIRRDYGRTEWKNSGYESTTVYDCEPKEGKVGYIIDFRLNPLMDYTIQFTPWFTDTYWQKLSKNTEFKAKTGPIPNTDKYIYSSNEWNTTQVIPSGIPITQAILSVNIESADLSVCELDVDGYLKYLTQKNTGYNYHFPSVCKALSQKTIAIKNHFWDITPTKIDIEKDVIGQTSLMPFLIVKGNIASASEEEYGRYFSHDYIRSNLSLTLEQGQNISYIFASSYDGKEIPDDLTFESYSFYDRSFHKLDTKITYDPKKKLYMTSDTAWTSIIIAKNDEYFGVINLNQDMASNYDFKYISGQDASNRDYAYIYTDRPLYKPGDSVYFKGILRNFQFDGYKPNPVKNVTLRITWGQNTVSGESTIYDASVPIDPNSNFHGEVTLPESIPLGRYAFQLEYYSWTMMYAYTNGEFFVDAYKKPVFKVNLEAEQKEIIVSETTKINGNAEYYFWWSLSNAEYAYSVLSQKYYFNPRDYGGYIFSEWTENLDCLYWWYCNYHDQLESSGTGKLDENGKLSRDFTLSEKKENQEKIYTYSVEVTDTETRKTVKQSTNVIVHATDGYVGIKIPYWNTQKTGVPVEGVVLDREAKELVDKWVWIAVYRRDWKTVKKEWVDGVYYNESQVEETLVASRIARSGKDGTFRETFLSLTGGEYIIRATYTGSNNVGFTSSAYTYVGGNDEYYWYDSNNSVIDMTADKTIVSVGESVGFTLKTPIQSGKLFISIEKDDGIMDAYIQDFTGTTSRIELKVNEKYIPNVYVKVFVIGKNPGEILPVYKRALSVIKVLPDAKKLQVQIKTDKEKYLPGEPVKINIHVQDSEGNPVSGANGSISLVDQSLLALAGNPLKNPFVFFYDMKRYLWVNTYSSLYNLIKKLEVKDTSSGEKWGAWDGQKWWLSKKKRWIFKDTAYWLSDFVTDKNGDFSITTPVLPDNLTTWTLEALVNTKKTQVWISYTTIQTSKNVIINDNLPRYLGTTDTITFAPVIFNKTGKDAEFEVSMEATNIDIEEKKKKIKIPSWWQATVLFISHVNSIEWASNSIEKSSKITLSARSLSSNDEDTMTVTLPIVENMTKEMVSTVGKTEGAQDETIEIPALIRKNGGILRLNYSASIIGPLVSGIKFLAEYPYGCVEQQLAAIMPHIYLKKLTESMGKTYDLKKIMVKKYAGREDGYVDISIDASIREVILNLPSYQKSDGGIAYWSDSYESDIYLTVLMLSRLQEIQEAGFSLPEWFSDKALQYIKEKFYQNKRPYCLGEPCSFTQSFRLTMIRAVLEYDQNDYDAYKMYQLLSADFEKSPNTTLEHAEVLIKLLKSNSLEGERKTQLETLAKSMLEKIGSDNVVINPRWAFISNSESNTRLSSTLSFIRSIVSLDDKNLHATYDVLLDQMSRWVLSQRLKDGSWWSTENTVDVIRTFTLFEKMNGKLGEKIFKASVSLDNNLLLSEDFSQENMFEAYATGISLSTLGESSRFHFEKIGTWTLYYDIGLEYFLKASGLKAREEWFYLESEYYDYSAYKIIEQKKNEEWENYIYGNIRYSDLKYPDSVTTYLTPLSKFKVGELVFVENRVIVWEARDQVAFEWFIPSGTELVNPNLKTESLDVSQESSDMSMSIFAHEEWQDDRYFATTPLLYPGDYAFHYVIRPTHRGTYEVRPSRIFEFYNGEVFWRTNGRSVVIEE